MRAVYNYILARACSRCIFAGGLERRQRWRPSGRVTAATAAGRRA